MDIDLLFKRLQNFEFLRGLDLETLHELARQGTWKVFPEDGVVFWEGDTETSLYFLQYGWLKVFKSGADGREQVMRFLGPGEVFNEIGVFGKGCNPATAIALEEAGIWMIPRHALEQIVLQHPQTALQLLESMAQRVNDLVTLVADLSLRTVEGRLAKMLLEQAIEGVIERRRWTTQTELAAHLGTVPDVLSRVMRELSKQGLIEVSRQQIRILDREALGKRAMMENE